MTKQKKFDTSGTAPGHTEDPVAEVEATIVAGGDVVGTTADDELLVEGPNSE